MLYPKIQLNDILIIGDTQDTLKKVFLGIFTQYT